MLNKEELQILVEREGIAEYFNVIDSSYLEETECTLYELETDYYAVMFRIFPAPYVGENTEKKIVGAMSCGLPVDSVVQFHQICSRNVTEHKKNYENSIVDDVEGLNVEHPSMLKSLHDAHLKFLDKHVDKTVFEKTKLAFYIRDFINTVTFLIPMRDENEVLREAEDLIPYISKLKGSLYSLFPQDINEHQYIRIMRELITPYNPMPETFRDPNLDIRDHFCDIDSTLSIEEGGILKFASSKNINFKSQVEEKKTKKAGLFKRLKRRFAADNMQHKEETARTEANSEVWYAKVLSRKLFPKYADLHSIVNLSMDYFNNNTQQQIPLPYVICLTVKIEDTEKASESVKESARWNKWQLDNAGKLASFFPELQHRAVEADDVLHTIANGDIPMKASYTAIFYSTDKQDLEYNVSIVKAEHKEKGFVLQEEDLITLPVFMYSLPMKYDEIYREFSKRFQTIFQSNVASIVPLGTDSRGFGQDAVIQLFGRNGLPQILDLYDRKATNKNGVVVAPSGKGKSFFTQRLVWSYLRKGSKIRIIDSGHSYRPLCTSFGGQYITFPENSDICINPFTEVRLDMEGNMHEDEVANLTNSIGIMAGFDLSETQTNTSAEIVNILSSYISSAVTIAFDVAGTEAGMKEVGDALRQILKNQKESARVEGEIRDGDVDRRLTGLITSLQEFTNPNGMYYKYVNGPANIHFNSNLIILDLDDLSGKQKKFRDFVLSTMTSAIEREFYRERENTQRKLFFIDEAWTLLDGKAGSTILGLYRRARKMRGSILTITQSINDFYKNENIRGIYENAYWRFFLEQDNSAMKTAVDENKLVLDPYAFELLKTVETKIGEYSEVMVVTEPGDLMIGRTLATRVEYWISTQDERDCNVAAEVAKAFNISDIQARTAIGFSEMNETSLESEVIKLLGYEDVAIEELMEA